LWEDELNDNGTCSITVKVRVMPKRMLCLSRMFLRIDGMMVRIWDTRILHEFGTDYFLREVQRREETFEGLAKLEMQEIDRQYTDANVLFELLKPSEVFAEKIFMKT
jgi:type 2A phosphatase activator TIP41